MLMKWSVAAPAIVVSVVVAFACGAVNPVTPSAPQPSVQPGSVPPVISRWQVAARLTTVTGGECVGEALQSQIGVPTPYSLVVTWNGNNVDATLTSASGDLSCTYTGGTGDRTGFTFGRNGWFKCEPGQVVRNFPCGNGVLRDTESLGQTISASISGTEITGIWRETRAVTLPGDLYNDVGYLETTRQFTGSLLGAEPWGSRRQDGARHESPSSEPRRRSRLLGTL